MTRGRCYGRNELFGPGYTKRILVLLLALCAQGSSVAVPKALSVGELTLARNYVLAACIQDRYPNTDLAMETDAWASSIVESGNLRASDYAALAIWAKSAPPPRTSRSGVAMRLQSCVDFINSSKFPKEIKRILSGK